MLPHNRSRRVLRCTVTRGLIILAGSISFVSLTALDKTPTGIVQVALNGYHSRDVTVLLLRCRRLVTRFMGSPATQRLSLPKHQSRWARTQKSSKSYSPNSPSQDPNRPFNTHRGNRSPTTLFEQEVRLLFNNINTTNNRSNQNARSRPPTGTKQ